MAKIKSYTQAVEELEEILRQLEQSDEVNMDAITEKVKRASELMQFCKKKLHTLDEELNREFDKFE
jgi:exodeoxyribonuclease VII small subunit